VNPKNTYAASMTTAELKKLWEPAAQGQIKRWNQVRDGGRTPKSICSAPASIRHVRLLHRSDRRQGQASRGDYTRARTTTSSCRASAATSSRSAISVRVLRENKNKLKLVAVDDGNESNGAGAILPSPETVGNGTYGRCRGRFSSTRR
jgi:phosphate transport system substrate-binding protein